MKKLLTILGVIILSFSFFVVPSIYVLAHNNNCEYNCHTPSPTPHPTHSPTPKPCDDNWNEKSHDCLPNPTPTASASATPLPTATPCLIWEGEFEVPCPSPTDTPLATPIDITAGIIPPAPAGAPICTDGSIQYAPTLTVFNRTSSDTVHLEWTTTDTNQFIVYYGLVNSGQFPWNTGPFIGQSIDLHKVPNESINVKVCSVGSCGEELCGAIIDP